MMKISHAALCATYLLAGVSVYAGQLGKVSYVEGEAFLLEKGKEKPLKVNQKIELGDKIHTGAESVAEVTYAQGTVIRIGEKSDVTLSGAEVAGNVNVSQGKVWANVHKLASGKFAVTTPVATAAVRGTVFRVDAAADSSSTIALYNGRVDVGPADTTKLKAEAPSGAAWGPPTQVAGPYEVTMETWVHLDPGKEINVRWGGKFATHDIDATSDAQNKWIKFNQDRDKELGIDRH